MRLIKLSSKLFKPLPPSFLLTYSRSTSLFLWKLPDMHSSFLVFLSTSSISCSVHSKIPAVGTKIGSANVLCAIVLFLEFNSDDHIALTRLKYSFKIFPLLIDPSYWMFSSSPRYLYSSPSFNYLIVTSLLTIDLPTAFLWHFSI